MVAESPLCYCMYNFFPVDTLDFQKHGFRAHHNCLHSFTFVFDLLVFLASIMHVGLGNIIIILKWLFLYYIHSSVLKSGPFPQLCFINFPLSLLGGFSGKSKCMEETALKIGLQG